MLDDIVLFLKIIELGSFRKAADFSRISLSTMSKRISNLEERLNHKLMIRNAKNITLTEYGVVINTKFQNLLTLSKKIENINNGFKIQENNIDNCITIYLGVNIAHSLINHHLDFFLEANPSIKLNIIYQINPGSDDDIKGNIILTTHLLENKDYTTHLLRNEYLQFYCSRDYVKVYGVPQNISELSEHKLIGGISEHHSPVNHIVMKNMFTNERATFNSGHTRLKVNNPFFMKNIGISSDAIFPCWSSLCKDDLLTGKIVRVLPDWTIYTAQVFLIIRNNLSLAEQLVANFLIECCTE